MRVTNFKIDKGKELESKYFKYFNKYLGENRPRTDGEIDVYLGIVAPEKWVAEEISGINVVNGEFTSLVNSLNNQEPGKLNSPTSPDFPEDFNFYAIFEVTIGSDFSGKLK